MFWGGTNKGWQIIIKIFDYLFIFNVGRLPWKVATSICDVVFSVLFKDLVECGLITFLPHQLYYCLCSSKLMQIWMSIHFQVHDILGQYLYDIMVLYIYYVNMVCYCYSNKFWHLFDGLQIAYIECRQIYGPFAFKWLSSVSFCNKLIKIWGHNGHASTQSSFTSATIDAVWVSGLRMSHNGLSIAGTNCA